MTEFFTRLFGNRETKDRIGSAVLRDTLPHAFLVIGPEGSGRHTLVTEIAAALNCERRHDEGTCLPCHVCHTCRRILDRQFTDVKTLDRQPGKATLGVDEIRKFREDMFLSATESDYKIYVIEHAETMTPQAQNALLKVLEEPPTRVVLFLLAEATGPILVTIKSRVQLIRMTRFSAEEIEKYLLETDENARSLSRTSRDALRVACLSADGVIGAAKQSLDPKLLEEKRKERELTLRLIAASAAKTPYETLCAAISALPQKRTDLIAVLENTIRALRDLIASKRDTGVPLLFYADRAEARRMSETMTQKRLLAVYDIFLSAQEKTARNGNVTLILSRLGSDLCML